MKSEVRMLECLHDSKQGRLEFLSSHGNTLSSFLLKFCVVECKVFCLMIRQRKFVVFDIFVSIGIARAIAKCVISCFMGSYQIYFYIG